MHQLILFIALERHKMWHCNRALSKNAQDKSRRGQILLDFSISFCVVRAFRIKSCFDLHFCQILCDSRQECKMEKQERIPAIKGIEEEKEWKITKTKSNWIFNWIFSLWGRLTIMWKILMKLKLTIRIGNLNFDRQEFSSLF